MATGPNGFLFEPYAARMAAAVTAGERKVIVDEMRRMFAFSSQKAYDVLHELNAFVLSGGDKTKLLKSLGMVIEEQTKDRFDTKRDPGGNTWRNITEAYRTYLTKHFPGAQPPLVREGGLRDSIENQLAGSDSILIGATAEYADYHQSAKKENRRRKFLGFSTSNIIELQDAVDEFMKAHVS